jgi:pimeloyl-ACP methyl ester carboxylesterase
VRGFGTTRFLSSDTPRNGQPSAVAADVVDLMDALGIDRAILAGFDWGARSANIVAALWLERCTGTVSVSGYLIGNQQAGKLPLPPPAEYPWWYQFYFATERGRAGYERHLHDFAKLIWRLTGELSRRSGAHAVHPLDVGGLWPGRRCARPSRRDPRAANYLHASGAPGNYRVALYHYNPRRTASWATAWRASSPTA